MKQLLIGAFLALIVTTSLFCEYVENTPLVTVEEAKKLQDNTWVRLKGVIFKKLSKDEYSFHDSTGVITIEVDKELFRDITIISTDVVMIEGEVDAEMFKQPKIDVKVIKHY